MQRILLLVLTFIWIGCSTSQNSLKNRTYHQMTAWFNILFNGEEAMNERLASLRSEYTDDYSKILPIEPLPEFESKEYEYDEDLQINRDRPKGSLFNKLASGNLQDNSTSSRSGFEKAEEKAIKAIEKHSMEIKKVERNSIISRAYLLLGKARYYQGKTFPALDALNYARENLPKTKWDEEIDLYLALAHIQSKNKIEAEKRLSELYYDEKGKVDKKKKALVSSITAQYLINEKNDSGAIEALNKALETVKGRDRKARYHFILGQLYTKLKDNNRAAEHFTQVYDLKPGFDMEVESQIAIAENFDSTQNSYPSYKNHLLKVAKKGNYVSRKNEFHYAIGEVARRAGRMDEAKEFLTKSINEEKVSDPYVRAKAYESYAKIEFKNENYIYAKAYYDSAIAAVSLEGYTDELRKKNKSLEEVVSYHYLIEKNDSILRIANLPKNEQENFFESHIEKIKVEDEKKRIEAEKEQYTFLNESKAASFSNTFGEDDRGKFYFYNTSAIGFGENEFKRIWGDVRLSDGWRYGKVVGPTTADQEAELLGKEEEGNPRRYELGYYLEKIPNKPSVLDSLKVQRDSTQLKLGIAYYDVFANKRLAYKTLEELIASPAKRKEDDLVGRYNLYRIADKEKDSKSTAYADQVLTKYPESIYAEYIRNPESLFSQGNTPEALAAYEETYDAFKKAKFSETMTAYDQAKEKFRNQPILAKYALIRALSIGRLKGKEALNLELKKVVVDYRGLPEAETAKKWMKQEKMPKKVGEKAKEKLALPKEGEKLFR